MEATYAAPSGLTLAEVQKEGDIDPMAVSLLV
jgi:hypothetical protein